VVSGKLYQLEGSRHIGEAYVALAQAVGVGLNSFGAGQGAVPGVLA
jgi:hypothetical protein